VFSFETFVVKKITTKDAKYKRRTQRKKSKFLYLYGVLFAGLKIIEKII